MDLRKRRVSKDLARDSLAWKSIFWKPSNACQHVKRLRLGFSLICSRNSPKRSPRFSPGYEGTENIFYFLNDDEWRKTFICSELETLLEGHVFGAKLLLFQHTGWSFNFFYLYHHKTSLHIRFMQWVSWKLKCRTHSSEPEQDGYLLYWLNQPSTTSLDSLCTAFCPTLSIPQLRSLVKGTCRPRWHVCDKNRHWLHQSNSDQISNH